MSDRPLSRVVSEQIRGRILDAQINGELLPETLGLQNWCTVQSRKPFVEALSGLLIGLESQVPRIYSKTTPPLLEKYGFSEEEVTFFTIHIAADIEHGEKGYEIVEKYATTDEQRAACVRNVREATMMRRLYLDGVWRTFVEKADQKLAA
jgi:pyrroloquinoline-quinone synthase